MIDGRKSDVGIGDANTLINVFKLVNAGEEFKNSHKGFLLL